MTPELKFDGVMGCVINGAELKLTLSRHNGPDVEPVVILRARAEMSVTLRSALDDAILLVIG